jgi:hypothetical protein
LFVAVVVDLVVVVVFVCCCFCNFFALCLHHFPYFRVLIGFYFILFSLLLCAFHLNIYIYIWLSLRPSNSAWRQCHGGKCHVLISRQVHHTSLRFF